MSKIFFLIILVKLSAYLCINNTNTSKFVIMPFSIEEENLDEKEYNSYIFIKNNCFKNLILEFNLGTPSTKVNGLLIQDSLCLELKEEKEDIKNIISDKYTPKNSTSFSFYNKHIYKIYDKDEFMYLGYDYINFVNNKTGKYNLSFLFEKSYDENISINEFSDKKYFSKIGLQKPLYCYYDIKECPNFLCDIKKKALLNKYTVSFEFINSTKGNIIIGDEMFNYNHKKYFYSQFKFTHTNDDAEIFFDNIIVPYQNNHNFSFNGSYGQLNLNLGVIIGSKEYKEVIDEIFFNKLVGDKICFTDNITYNTSQSYFVYSCDEKKIDSKSFPKLIFESKAYLYNFQFDFSDLFIKKDNKYYFQIIFKSNNIPKVKDKWTLGQPFFKKYTFTFNLEDNVIAFYNPSLPIDKNELSNDTENGNSNYKKIIFIVFLLIIFFGLLYLSFYLGMKIKKEKKKRANELDDDDYEYFSKTKEELGL